MSNRKPGKYLQLWLAAPDLVNRIIHNSDPAGWTAPSPYTLQVDPNKTTRMELFVKANTTSFISTPAFNVTPGEYINGAISFNDIGGSSDGSSVYIESRITFLNSSGAVVYSSTVFGDKSPATSNGDVVDFQARGLDSGGVQVASATKARFDFRFKRMNSWGAITNPDQVIGLWNVTAVGGPTEASVSGVTSFSTQNILAKAISCNITRGGDIDGVTDSIDVGMLTATIIDPYFDPTQNQRIKIGAEITAFAVGGGGPVFTGEISEFNVDDSASKTDPNKPSVITLTAVDRVAKLQNDKAPYNYSGSFNSKVTQIMGYSSVGEGAWNFTKGADSTAVYLDENASVWDQLQLARNSFINAKVWIDTENRVCAQTFTDPTVVLKYGDKLSYPDDSSGNYTPYVGFSSGFGSKDLVNSLMITAHNTSETDGEFTYGPYSDQTSITNYGANSASVDMIDGDVVSLVNNYLTKYAYPSSIPQSITVNYNDVNLNLNLPDIYSLVRVRNSRKGIDQTAYVIGIDHEITPTRWLMTLRFRPRDTGYDPITITNPAGGELSGPADELEYPAPKAAFGVARSSGTLVTTTGYQDVPGMSVDIDSLGPNAAFAVDTSCWCVTTGTPTGTLQIRCVVDGVAPTEQNQIARLTPGGSSWSGNIGTSWIFTNLEKGTHTIKIQALSTTTGFEVRTGASALRVFQIL